MNDVLKSVENNEEELKSRFRFIITMMKDNPLNVEQGIGFILKEIYKFNINLIDSRHAAWYN